MTQPTISKRIQQLETQLGSLLLSGPCTPRLDVQLPLQVFDAALQLDALKEADLHNDSRSRHCG